MARIFKVILIDDNKTRDKEPVFLCVNNFDICVNQRFNVTR